MRPGCVGRDERGLIPRHHPRAQRPDDVVDEDALDLADGQAELLGEFASGEAVSGTSVSSS